MTGEGRVLPAGAIAALGPVNRKLASLIGRQNPGSIRELAEMANMPQPNVSRALASLGAAGIVRLEGTKSKRPVLVSRYAVFDLIDNSIP